MLQNRQQPNALPPLRKQGRIYSGATNQPQQQSPTNNNNNNGYNDATPMTRNGTFSYGTLPSRGSNATAHKPISASYNDGTEYSGGTVFTYYSNGNGPLSSYGNGGNSINGHSNRRAESDDRGFAGSYHETNGKPNIQTASILKKTGLGQRRRYSSTPSLHQVFNQNDGTYRSPQTDRRRVNFKNKVSIFRFGGSDGDRICNSSECEPLKDPSPSSPDHYALPAVVSPPYSPASIYIDDDEDVRPDKLVARLANRSPPLVRRLPRRQVSGGVSNGVPSPLALPQDPNAGPLVFRINDGSVIISGSDQQRPSGAHIGHIDYTRTADNCLQLVIRLDTRGRDIALRPNDLLVKANKTGDRLRVVTSVEAEERRSGSLRINELVKLPKRVDAYRLVARLDASGHLVVHAPMLK